MMLNIEGKVALVTGATRGIGKAIALQLASQGATVVGTATSESGAAAISAYLSAAGNAGKGMILNVSDSQSVESVLKELVAEFGAPTVLINNAGITKDNLLMRMKEDEWDAVVNTNLSSMFRLAKGCLRGMTKARWGRVVNISSVVASMGNMGQTNYAATKAGVEGFSRSMAREVASRNITVNSIAPGFIATDMTDALGEEQKDALRSQIPLQRLGTPEDIAALVGFLVSDAGSYITGETIHVNGGMYMG
jgi:3-oxoacyl-[acyl-carrier protein] reductase